MLSSESQVLMSTIAMPLKAATDARHLPGVVVSSDCVDISSRTSALHRFKRGWRHNTNHPFRDLFSRCAGWNWDPGATRYDKGSSTSKAGNRRGHRNFNWKLCFHCHLFPRQEVQGPKADTKGNIAKVKVIEGKTSPN